MIHRRIDEWHEICRLEDKGVHPDSEFKQILKNRLFADAGEEENASLSHLISIYVERHFTLYKATFSITCISGRQVHTQFSEDCVAG